MTHQAVITEKLSGACRKGFPKMNPWALTGQSPKGATIVARHVSAGKAIVAKKSPAKRDGT